MSLRDPNKDSNAKRAILRKLTEYLEAYPTIRFGQALFNLGIVEFADKGNPEAKDHLLRDIYNDDDLSIWERSEQNYKTN